ncbi:hypothetical protein HBI75_207130 [Parastagonospora nodorum]|nr:hypothetical protein HBH43_221830 [Parastagonospora nodorum]KAH5010130.1 hypothetical protein HBI75_207130 [Parastagonospora nodorum]
MDIIQKLMKRTSVPLKVQREMVDERKTLNDTTVGKGARADIIEEQIRVKKTIAGVRYAQREALQAQKFDASLAHKGRDDTNNIIELDKAIERIKMNNKKLIEQKYQKLTNDLVTRHKKEVRRLERENEKREEDLKRERNANEENLENMKRHTAVIEQRLIKLQFRQKLVKTPVFTNNITSIFQLAINETSFYFRGPKHTLGEWHSPRDGVRDLSDSKHQATIMGQDRTCIVITQTGFINFSEYLSTTYAHLNGIHNEFTLDSARQIVLGCDGRYFIQGKEWTQFHLDDVIREDSRMKNCKEIDVCALGRSGAYVIQFSSGALIWDLKGQYYGLERRIEEDVEPGKKKFAALALSLTDQCFVALFKWPNAMKATSYSLRAPNAALKARWKHWAEQESDMT